jgi:hypothetical protein
MEECIICKESCDFTIYPCKHFLHQECLEKYIKYSKKFICPYCTQPISNIDPFTIVLDLDINDAIDLLDTDQENLSSYDIHLLNSLSSTVIKYFIDVFHDSKSKRRQKIFNYILDFKCKKQKQVRCKSVISGKFDHVYQKSKPFTRCEGHESYHWSEDCSLCNYCGKWIYSGYGFYHCCCYTFDNKNIL